MLPVGRGDAPVVVGVAAFEAEAEGFVGAGCGDGVGEVVGVGVALCRQSRTRRESTGGQTAGRVR